MARIRKHHGNKFKFKVALSALGGTKTVAELCQEFCLVASQIYAWKKQLEENGPEVFADKRKNNHQEDDMEKLHAKIGKLLVERDFLSNALGKLR